MFICFNSCHSNHIVLAINLSIVQVAIIIIILAVLVWLCYVYRIKKIRKWKRHAKIDSYESYLLHTLINNMPDFIYIKDKESRFLIANKHTADIMNAGSPDNIIGKSDFDFFPKKMAEKFYHDEQHIMQTKSPLINIQEEVLDQESKVITISTTKVPWFDNDGNILGIIGIGRNISKIKKTEKQLIKQAETLKEANSLLHEQNEKIQQQAEELAMQAVNFKELNRELKKINETKDKFISIIAHDLKNPFNAIINFSELLILKGDASIKPKYMGMIKIINSSSKMAYSLLENLLYWAKNQNASISFYPSQLNLTDLIKEVVDFHEVSAMLKNIIVMAESEPNLQIFADQNMVTTILRNLISNAIKFTPKNGKVKIVTTSDTAYAYINITDTGIGLSKEQMEKLFFSDKEITKGTSGESGTGFGLLLCYEFAQLNKGNITVKSNLEKGSTFILSLPLRSES
jgi:PAS domain S-box-containing protein